MPYPSKTSPGAILGAALELLEQRGTAALTMRSLASKLGVRPSSLYRHFSDREALEHALADEASHRLHTVLREAAADQPPHEALHALSLAYVRYAREHATLYELIIRPRPLQSATPGPGKDLWNYLLERIGAITGDPDDTAAAVALWSLLHGFVALERSGMFGQSGPQGALTTGIGAMLVGLQSNRQRAE